MSDNSIHRDSRSWSLRTWCLHRMTEPIHLIMPREQCIIVEQGKLLHKLQDRSVSVGRCHRDDNSGFLVPGKARVSLSTCNSLSTTSATAEDALRYWAHARPSSEDGQGFRSYSFIAETFCSSCSGGSAIT